jgi:hypothetical protein
MRKEILLLPVSLIIVLIGALTFVIAENDEPIATLYGAGSENNQIGEDDELVACTMDAKLCPDGSYVGRVAPDCEFEPCPTSNTCICPSGYIAEGNICNPKCYYSQPPCLAPSITCKGEENETEHPILGASCGTVTPGYQNECCVNKGYDSWDAKKWECVKETEEEKDERDELVGKSCGTVTPGMQNDCCQRKGYKAWDAEEFECLDKEDMEVNNECEEWNCTKWSECSSEGIRTRECVQSQLNCADEKDEDELENETEIKEDEQPKLTRECYERKELRPHNRTIECPEECVCSGSTIKCTFENGTREMTIYAGNSGNVIVQIKNLNMSTNVTLYKGENGKVYGVFKNNETKEIHLPDEVKERLQNYTHRKLYNESVNLTDDGYYKIEGKKKARLFWIVPVKEHMTAEVNAETGETVKIRNPWWGFMARDVREKNNSED